MNDDQINQAKGNNEFTLFWEEQHRNVIWLENNMLTDYEIFCLHQLLNKMICNNE